MVNGLHLYSALQYCLTFTSSCINSSEVLLQWQRQPRKVTAGSSGGVRCLAQGHLNAQLGGAGDRTSNLAFTRQNALPPELLPSMICNFLVRLAVVILYPVREKVGIWGFIIQLVGLFSLCIATSSQVC